MDGRANANLELYGVEIIMGIYESPHQRDFMITLSNPPSGFIVK